MEKIGLVKFDFLGLRTLTILDWTVRYIRQRERTVNGCTCGTRKLLRRSFSLENLPLDDLATYALLRQGNAVGVFQFESRGMKDLLQKARPDRFEDIIALVALYRPGPMSLIPEFIERKHGKRVEYLDPRLRPILEPTYGIMVYQEQVMQIAQVIGGYSLGNADLLRRAMGKKKPEEMALHRDIFVAGAVKNGLTESGCSRALRSDGKVRGLWIQQIACRGLRPDRLSDCLPESALSGRVHGRHPFRRHGRYR